MQAWKFLLFGITGDLSKKKILPALSQFAQLNEEKVQIDLVGYSRSQPNSEEINQILYQNNTSGKHNLQSVNFVQGAYEDPTIFYDLISKLKGGERLITYLAVPPSAFIRFLQNACPFSDKEIDVLIEKPFGRDSHEYKQIMDVVYACTLSDKVHFLDHYLFKTATFLSKGEVSNFKDFKSQSLESLKIQALENLGVEDRLGYYTETGALKDMFTHLFSLLNLILQTFNLGSLEEKNNFIVDNLILGQYANYTQALEDRTSQTDTYFQVEGNYPINNQNTHIVFESGKNLGRKLTQIQATFNDGSNLTWQIAPESRIQAISSEQEFSLNLHKTQKLDHTNLFENLLVRDHSHFVSQEHIGVFWAIYDTILAYKEQQHTELIRYKDNFWPLEKI